MLSNLDSQQLLTYDNVTTVGAYNDNDMLTVCNGGQTTAEYRAQFSAWVSSLHFMLYQCAMSCEFASFAVCRPS